MQADGRLRPQCARVDGAALSEARRRTCPELSDPLVVLAAEVGGSWSDEARAFVSQLAKAKARCWLVVHVRRGNIGGHQCWLVRLLDALSLLDKRPALGSDGDTPSSSDVVAACRHLPLGSTL